MAPDRADRLPADGADRSSDVDGPGSNCERPHDAADAVARTAAERRPRPGAGVVSRDVDRGRPGGVVEEAADVRVVARDRERVGRAVGATAAGGQRRPAERLVVARDRLRAGEPAGRRECAADVDARRRRLEREHASADAVRRAGSERRPGLECSVVSRDTVHALPAGLHDLAADIDVAADHRERADVTHCPVRCADAERRPALRGGVVADDVARDDETARGRVEVTADVDVGPRDDDLVDDACDAVDATRRQRRPARGLRVPSSDRSGGLPARRGEIAADVDVRTRNRDGVDVGVGSGAQRAERSGSRDIASDARGRDTCALREDATDEHAAVRGDVEARDLAVAARRRSLRPAIIHCARARERGRESHQDEQRAPDFHPRPRSGPGPILRRPRKSGRPSAGRRAGSAVRGGSAARRASALSAQRTDSPQRSAKAPRGVGALRLQCDGTDLRSLERHVRRPPPGATPARLPLSRARHGPRRPTDCRGAV